VHDYLAWLPDEINAHRVAAQKEVVRKWCSCRQGSGSKRIASGCAPRRSKISRKGSEARAGGWRRGRATAAAVRLAERPA